MEKKEVKTVNKDLVPFDQARAGVVMLKRALDEIEVKDRETRDNAFVVCKGSSRILKKISEVRIDCIKPLKEHKARFKKQYEADIAPLDERIKKIEIYAKEGLSEGLNEIVKLKHNEIMVWDEDERIRQEEEQRRVEEAERKQREEEEARQRAIQEEQERKQREIDEKKAKEIAEAEKLKGIERAKARKKAEEEARIEAEKAVEEAAEQKQQTSIAGAMDRCDFVDQKENLDASKLKGRAKKELGFEIVNLRKLPFDFLLNPRADQKKILQWGRDMESKGQKPAMNGVKFLYSEKLKYQ